MSGYTGVEVLKPKELLEKLGQHMQRYRITTALGILCLLLGACMADEAHREYMAALRGDEDGSTPEQRMAHFDRAVELAPSRSEYRVSRAVALIDQRELSRALADLDAANALTDHPYTRFLRGLVLCQQGRFEDSLTDFDAAIAAQPENTQFYRGRGLALAETGRFDAAWEDAAHLVAVAPHQAESYYVRARVQAGFGRFDDAVGDLNRVIEMRPELIYPRSFRADCLRRSGQPELADADEREVAQRVSRSAPAVYVDPFRY